MTAIFWGSYCRHDSPLFFCYWKIHPGSYTEAQLIITIQEARAFRGSPPMVPISSKMLHIHVCICVHCCCLVARLCPIFCDPMDCSLPVSSVHWNGLPFPSPGPLPNPGIEPVSPALSQSHLVSPCVYTYVHKYNTAFSNLRHQGPGTQMLSAWVTSDSSPALPAYLSLRHPHQSGHILPCPPHSSASHLSLQLSLHSATSVFLRHTGDPVICLIQEL